MTIDLTTFDSKVFEPEAFDPADATNPALWLPEDEVRRLSGVDGTPDPETYLGVLAWEETGGRRFARSAQFFALLGDEHDFVGAASYVLRRRSDLDWRARQGSPWDAEL